MWSWCGSERALLKERGGGGGGGGFIYNQQVTEGQ